MIPNNRFEKWEKHVSECKKRFRNEKKAEEVLMIGYQRVININDRIIDLDSSNQINNKKRKSSDINKLLGRLKESKDNEEQKIRTKSKKILCYLEGLNPIQQIQGLESLFSQLVVPDSPDMIFHSYLGENIFPIKYFTNISNICEDKYEEFQHLKKKWELENFEDCLNYARSENFFFGSTGSSYIISKLTYDGSYGTRR